MKSYKEVVILLAPFLVISLFFLFIPLLKSLYYSFFEISFLNLEEKTFIGLENYSDLFYEGEFVKSLLNALVFVLLISPATVLISFLLALAVVDEGVVKRLGRTAFYLPYILTPVAVAAIAVILFKKDGFLTSFFTYFGFANESWLTNKSLSKLLVSIAVVWTQVGFYMVIYITALKSVSEQIYEAAELDGASRLQRVLFITIPGVRNITFLAFFMSVLTTIQLFDLPFIISTYGLASPGSPGGETMTPVMYVYTQAFRYNEPGIASAAALIIVTLIAVLSVAQFKFIKGSQDD